MENIKLGLFDIFGFIFPGLIMFFAIILPFLVQPNIFIIVQRFIVDANGLPFTFLILLISYIVGASVHQIGFIWYYVITFIIGYSFLRVTLKFISLFNKNFATKHLRKYSEKITLLKDHSTILENMVLVRQFAPEQLSALQEWTSKRAMSFNLSFGFFVLSLSSYLFLIKDFRSVSLTLVIFSVISSLMLLIRSYGYDFWWKSELKIIVEKFDLKNRELAKNTKAN